jgi:hypothetical protein
MSNRVAASISTQDKKRHHATLACLESLIIKDYLAGASSIVNLKPPVSTSSLLEKAAFHKSDREALLSDWHYVSDDLWSAYFSTEYAALNTKEQK